MGASPVHLLRQGPVVWSLLKAATKGPGKEGPGIGDATLPGPVLTANLPPRNAAMVRDYIRLVGGDPSWYRGAVPPHLFPQWGFPLLASTLGPLSYDMRRILNAGCKMEIHRPLPADQPLNIEAQLMSVDDNGKRALLTERLLTGTDEAPGAIECHATALVPLPRDKGADGTEPQAKKEKKERPRVPEGAREIHRWKLSPTSGRDFAFVTGDINPIHWVAAYGKMAGFKGRIAHGFSGMARLAESLNRQLWSGDVSRLASLEVRFVRPLRLPAKVGVYVDDEGGCFVGDAPGGPAYFSGTYTERTTDDE
ncbi:MAG: MaoC/PaaZ C-terminal domain-containing protein [Myxococcota bacterium]|nr:MaoC/PaaZ C-terminal domain-containing protein [Myxococcota bacterium]